MQINGADETCQVYTQTNIGQVLKCPFSLGGLDVPGRGMSGRPLRLTPYLFNKVFPPNALLINYATIRK